jgi:hypothetical protein
MEEDRGDSKVVEMNELFTDIENLYNNEHSNLKEETLVLPSTDYQAAC